MGRRRRKKKRKKTKKKSMVNRKNLTIIVGFIVLVLLVFQVYQTYYVEYPWIVFPEGPHVGYYDIMKETKEILSFGARSHPNTKGLFRVRKYLKSRLKTLGYSVETQESKQDTPLFGQVKFVNIIGTVINDPSSKDYVVLSAHYDSKYFEDFEFVGATDSVVPVSMVLHLAGILNQMKRYNVIIILFDGEEAFGEWTDKDSLYGAKSLANEWKSTNFLKDKNIEMFLLIDLIGDENPMFLKFKPLIESNSQSEIYYNRMIEAESKVFGKVKYFTNRVYRDHIGDDHEPFVDFGFPIIHLIPVPFPKVWHKKNDNFENVHWESVYDVQKILVEFFVSKYRI